MFHQDGDPRGSVGRGGFQFGLEIEGLQEINRNTNSKYPESLE